MGLRLHGKGGSVSHAAGGYALHVHAWTFNRESETADGSEFGFVNRVKDEGLHTGRGTFVCYVDDTTALMEVGTSLTTSFKMSGTKKLVAKVIITGMDVKTNIDGNAEVTYSCELGGTAADGSANDFQIS